MANSKSGWRMVRLGQQLQSISAAFIPGFGRTWRRVFPRSGTELTVVRGGKVSESDIDLFVDMPSTKLQAALKPLLGELGNGLHLEGSGRDQELHWKTRCMFEVHMVFNGR